jgi:Protein of unknown function (DUF2798)
MLIFKLRRLPSRYGPVLRPFLLSILMSGIVSFIATLKNYGPHDGLVALWLGGWTVSWLIAFPTLLLVQPAVRRIVAILVESAPSDGGS